MTNNDYEELLHFTRDLLKKTGFGGIDERIMADIHGLGGPFGDLIYYLKHLTEEISLGSDVQLGNVLRRIRSHVQTESGDPIKGVRITLSNEHRERYHMEHIDLTPSPELGNIAEELRALIDQLYKDHQ